MVTSSLRTAETRKIAITAAYYLTFITLGITLGVTGPALPTLAQHTSTTLDGLSFMFITVALGYMFGTWIGGFVYDRFPGHWLLAIALVVASGMMFLIPIISALWLLALVAAVLGFFQGSMDVGGNTLLIWLHGSKVGPFMNGMHFFFGVGAFVAPLVVAQLLGPGGDIRWAYWLFAILNLPIAVWIVMLPSPVLHPKASSGEGLKLHTSPVTVGLLFVFFFFYVGLETSYGNWIYTYATTLHLADVTRAAYLSSTYWGAFTLFRLIGIWVSTRASTQSILLVDFAGLAVGLGLLLFLPASSAALWVGTVILGAGTASVFPVMLTLAEQRLHLTGSVTRWFFVGSGIGQMLLPWLIGQLFVSLGPTSMMLILGVDLVLNAIVLGLVLWMRPKPAMA